MNILFTLTFHTPYVSGLTIHVKRLSEALAQKKHKVTVLTCQYDKSLPRREDKEVTILRVPYWRKVHKGFLMPRYLFEAWKAVRSTDILIVNLPQIESIIPVLYARLQKKRVYAIYHCQVVLPSGLLNKLIQFTMHFLHILTLIFCQKIITYTQDYAKHSWILSLFTKKHIYIYPPTPRPEEDQRLTKALQEKIPTDKKYVIGVAARFAAEKGIEYLLEAIPFLQKAMGDEFIIVFAGPEHPVGEEAYWLRMQGLLRKYSDYIIFLGTIPQESMGSFYALLDVLLLPSVNATEAFGMVQVEAMLCGIPVVASDLPGVRVPIRETSMGELIMPRNSEALAQAILTIIRNKKKYTENRELVAKLFSFHDTIERYEKLLTK